MLYSLPSLIIRCPLFSVGGLNNQSLAVAGDEADLDIEFGFGLSHPISVSPVFRIAYSSFLLCF